MISCHLRALGWGGSRLAIFAIVEKNHVNNELRPGGVLCRLDIVTPSESFKDQYAVSLYVTLNVA